jgi:hypothetical protein
MEAAVDDLGLDEERARDLYRRQTAEQTQDEGHMRVL